MAMQLAACKMLNGTAFFCRRERKGQQGATGAEAFKLKLEEHTRLWQPAGNS